MEETRASLRSTQWLRRGWTLQELLAPRLVIFCDKNWSPFGFVQSSSKSCIRLPFANVADEVSRITRIDKKRLGTGSRRVSLGDVSIAEKMSWAASRATARIEDEAYCLMGIFNIHMPLIYGEGHRAFHRLQQELVKKSNDQSIFAWIGRESDQTTSMFARSPHDFKHSGYVKTGRPCPPYDITNRGLRLNAQYVEIGSSSSRPEVVLRLNCFVDDGWSREWRRHCQDESEDDQSPHRPTVLRSVILTLVKHKNEDQWYRDRHDDFGRGRGGMEYNKDVRSFLSDCEWHREKTFFIDAFRRGHHTDNDMLER